MAKIHESNMRRFVLERTEDVSGTSGVGIVAEGVLFTSGQVAMSWLSQLSSVTVFANITVVETIHGHDGRTKIVWL